LIKIQASIGLKETNPEKGGSHVRIGIKLDHIIINGWHFRKYRTSTERYLINRAQAIVIVISLSLSYKKNYKLNLLKKL
jgi:hypothetical protein